jgi:AcrR family transcriptional regulator
MATLTSTRDRLLETAHDLFYRDGFHAVGLDRIIAEVGVTKTTFYNHFESKDDLLLEVLRKHDQWWRNTFREKLREHGGDTPRGQLLAVFNVVDEVIHSADFNGCIFINVAVQYPLPHDPAHIAAREHKHKMEDILRELAGYAGAKDPQKLAEELALLMEGAYVTQQVMGDRNPVEIGKRLAAMLIAKHLPA